MIGIEDTVLRYGSRILRQCLGQHKNTPLCQCIGQSTALILRTPVRHPFLCFPEAIAYLHQHIRRCLLRDGQREVLFPAAAAVKGYRVNTDILIQVLLSPGIGGKVFFFHHLCGHGIVQHFRGDALSLVKAFREFRLIREGQQHLQTVLFLRRNLVLGITVYRITEVTKSRAGLCGRPGIPYRFCLAGLRRTRIRCGLRLRCRFRIQFRIQFRIGFRVACRQRLISCAVLRRIRISAGGILTVGGAAVSAAAVGIAGTADIISGGRTAARSTASVSG